MSQITYHALPGIYTVDGLPGKKFKTRAAAEKAYTNMMARETKERTRTVSFVVKDSLNNKLGEIAKRKNMTISALMREIVEKEVSDYGERHDG